MDALRKLLEQPSCLVILRERTALVVAPGQMLLVEPDQHRGRAWHGAERIGKADLEMALGDDRQLDADELGHRLLHWSGGKHEMGCLDRLALTLMLNVNRAHPPSGRVDADDLAPQELHPALPGRLQHHHSELLGAEPASAPRVRHRHRLWRQIGKVPADEARIGDDIRTVKREIEAMLGRRRIRARCRIVNSRGAAAPHFGRRRHGVQERDFSCVGGCEHVATTIQIDAVVGRASNLLDQIDAAVHEGGHRPIGAGPPIAVGFGRFVRRQRERVPLLDDHDVVAPVRDCEMIGCRDPRNAGAADDRPRCHRILGADNVANGRALSNARAARKTSASLRAGPTICSASGSPSAVKPHGTEAAGCWVRLNG